MARHVSVSSDRDLTRRVALVTGANCGIGAATAIELAARGTAVLLSYLRLTPAGASEGVPPAYAQQRASDATCVLETIRAAGGHAEAVEADLADTAAPAQLLDHAEANAVGERMSIPGSLLGVIFMALLVVPSLLRMFGST